MARISTPRRLAGSLLALTLVGAACGGDDDISNDAANDAADQVSDALGGTLPGGAPLPDDLDEILDAVTIPEELGDITIPDLDDFTDITIPDLDELTDMSVPDLDELTDMSIPEMAAVGSGSCSVSMTGAYNAEWSEEQNAGSGLVSYWLGDAEKAIWGDGLTIIANCTETSGNSFSLLSSNDADESTLPMAAGTYELAPSGALESSGVWSVLMTVADAEAVFGIAEPGGTLEVTEFDDDTFAFVLDAPVVDTFASMTGGTDEPSQLHVEYTLDKVDF